MSHSGAKRFRNENDSDSASEDEGSEFSKVDLTNVQREVAVIQSTRLQAEVSQAEESTAQHLCDMQSPRGSQLSQGSLVSSKGSQESSVTGEHIALDGCSEEQCKSFMTVSLNLRNQGEKRFNFPFNVYTDPNKLLSPEEHQLKKMAAVSKGFKLKSIKDPCRLTQPTEGTALTFVAECSGPEIPKPSMHVIYFAQRLKQFIESTGLQGFVVPTDNLVPQFDVSGKHIVCMMEKGHQIEIEAGDRNVGNESDVFSLVDMLARRNRSVIEDVPVKTFSVSVGFTCSYSRTQHGSLEKRIFCIVFLTPINCFDLLSYIQQTMLKAPSKGSADFEARNRDYNEMQFLWRMILDNEAYNAMCLPGHVGDPINEPPSGMVGLDSITSEFMIPLKINAMIRVASPGSYNVEIVGFPTLTFRKDDAMNDFREYIDAHINEVCVPVCAFAFILVYFVSKLFIQL